jgi:hypothetical protein
MTVTLTSLIAVAPTMAISAGIIYNLSFYWTFQNGIFTGLTIEDHITSAMI